MEHDLHQSHALDVFGFHVFDACDVKEVVLVVVRQVAFHLRRIHAAVRLRHENSGRAQLRENVDGHPAQRENGAQSN